MKSRGHTWALWTFLARRCCTHFGLVELRNEASRVAAKQPCKWWNE